MWNYACNKKSVRDGIEAQQMRKKTIITIINSSRQLQQKAHNRSPRLSHARSHIVIHRDSEKIERMK